MCLGKILLQDPDVLLLDEPTNHLDLDAIEWLEGYIKELEIPTVIVSHDREFLDQVPTLPCTPSAVVRASASGCPSSDLGAGSVAAVGADVCAQSGSSGSTL